MTDKTEIEQGEWCADLPKHLFLKNDDHGRPTFISGITSKGINQKLLKTLSIIETRTFKERGLFAKKIVESYNAHESIKQRVAELEEALREIGKGIGYEIDFTEGDAYRIAAKALKKGKNNDI